MAMQGGESPVVRRQSMLLFVDALCNFFSKAKLRRDPSTMKQSADELSPYKSGGEHYRFASDAEGEIRLVKKKKIEGERKE